MTGWLFSNFCLVHHGWSCLPEMFGGVERSSNTRSPVWSRWNTHLLHGKHLFGCIGYHDQSKKQFGIMWCNHVIIQNGSFQDNEERQTDRDRVELSINNHRFNKGIQDTDLIKECGKISMLLQRSWKEYKDKVRFSVQFQTRVILQQMFCYVWYCFMV